MEKAGAGGRPKAIDMWEHVTVLEGMKKVKCKYCGFEFAASANRIKSHIHQIKGLGIRLCTQFPQLNNTASNEEKQDLLDLQGSSILDRPREYDKLNEAMLDCYMSPKTMWDGIKNTQQVQTTTEAMHQERIKVGPFYVSSIVNESDLRLIQYSFEHSSDRCIVFSSSRSFLCQSQLTTIRPQTHLDSWVIDIFADILTEIERRKKSEPLNWYLPVMFSIAALNSGDISSFIDFVLRNNMRDNYMSDLAYCEKIFMPVHVGKNSSGHYYLYIIHMKNQEVEIWDSLCEQFMDKTKRDQITEKLLLAMEKLFVDVMFTKFHKKMASNILLQPNGYDCGIFIINYMQQSDNYVRINPSFQFDSHKERLDLVLKLLKSDLNKEKDKLYDEAAKSCAKVQGYQDLDSGHFKRKQCKTMFEDEGRGAYMKSDDSDDGDRRNIVGLITESPIPVNVSPFIDDIDGDHPELKPDSKKRKMIPKVTIRVKSNSKTSLEGTPDDGYWWKKYGQTDILETKYPRGYYRCNFRMTQNCWATKQIQRSDEDPSIFEITYRGKHTCSRGNIVVQPPKSPDQQQEKIHNYDLDTDNLDNEEMAKSCAEVQHYQDLDSGHFKRKQRKTIFEDVGRGAYMKSDDSNDGDMRNNVSLITGSLIVDKSRDYNKSREMMLDCYINELKKELELATNKDSRAPSPDKEQKSSNNQVNGKLLDLDIQVKIVGWDAMIRIQCSRRNHPAARLMVALQELDLEVMHASVSVVNDLMIQQATVKMGCRFFTQKQLRLALSFKLGDVR